MGVMYKQFISYKDILQVATEVPVDVACINSVAAAKDLAPRDTGLLKNSIHWRTSRGNGGLNEDPEGEQAKLTRIRPIDDRVGIVVATADYAVFQEYGTRYQLAQPFMRPGIEDGAKGATFEQIVRIRSEQIMRSRERLKKKAL